MMRVLHVIPAVAKRYGGPSAAVVGMCRALNEIGCSAEIVTTDADGSNRLDVPISKRTDYEGVPSTFFSRQFSESFKYSSALARWLRDRTSEFDVVHIHAVFSHASIAAGRAASRASVPYLVRPLGALDPWALAQHRLRKNLFLELVGKRLLHNASAIHYSTLAEQQRAERRIHAPQGVVVPLGVDEGLFTGSPADLQANATDPYLLFIGRLHPIKNIGSLISAFSAAAENTKWRLVIAGSGPEEYVRSLHALAARSSSAARISFAGWISGDEKAALLRGASAFAMPSMQESFGIALAEAMAVGVPVIVSRDVNLCDAIEEAGAGWVVDDFRAALLDAFADVEERRRRGANGREYASKHFRWSQVALRLRDVYQSLQAHPSVAGRLSWT